MKWSLIIFIIFKIRTLENLKYFYVNAKLRMLESVLTLERRLASWVSDDYSSEKPSHSPHSRPGIKLESSRELQLTSQRSGRAENIKCWERSQCGREGGREVGGWLIQPGWAPTHNLASLTITTRYRSEQPTQGTHTILHTEESHEMLNYQKLTF